MKKASVLICDDDQDILEVTRTVLELKGFHVNTLSDCNDIVQVVNSLRPGLILMDLWIPDVGGAMATRLLKSEEDTRNIPVVLFSANNNIEKVAVECGADDFLRKPYDIKDLENKVEQFLPSDLS
jgi:CheY-like chemotaxis protein